MIRGKVTALLLASACVIGFASAEARGGEKGRQRPMIDPTVLTESFLHGHPDLRWRGEGIRAYQDGDYGSAMAHFVRAARHADKPAQALVAGLYWAGEGVERDRALAYAWMDLAAERMYPDFVRFRERYWLEMDAAERKDALERGPAVYAQYGDDVAKPRLEAVMRRERNNSTISRFGVLGNVNIKLHNGPGAGTIINGTKYFDKKYWRPAEYWQLQDAIWMTAGRERVNVGSLEQVPASAPPEGPPDDP